MVQQLLPQPGAFPGPRAGKMCIRDRANEAAKAKAAAEKEPLSPAEPTEEIGFVSVAVGEGLKTLFTDLGCAHVVSGGQTMNPSTNDILEAVLATPAKTVMVLPNNKNIIMAAEQTVPLVKDRKVIVLPTRTIPQAVSYTHLFQDFNFKCRVIGNPGHPMGKR